MEERAYKERAVAVGKVVREELQTIFGKEFPKIKDEFCVNVLPALPEDEPFLELQDVEEILDYDEHLQFMIVGTIPEGTLFHTAIAAPLRAPMDRIRESLQGCFTDSEMRAMKYIIRKLKS